MNEDGYIACQDIYDLSAKIQRAIGDYLDDNTFDGKGLVVVSSLANVIANILSECTDDERRDAMLGDLVDTIDMFVRRYEEQKKPE